MNGISKSSLNLNKILELATDELIKAGVQDTDYSIDNLLNLYPYGSRVYGCAGPQSDYDMIAVYNSVKDKTEFSGQIVHVTAYSQTKFKKILIEHEISAIECVSLPEHMVLMAKNKYELSLSLSQLRKAISEKASHSYVKAKKKLTVEKDLDPYRGKKSLFHALRVIKFGCQIAKYGKIIDYADANSYWSDIVLNECNDWQFYNSKYKQEFNELMTEFRKLAPKEI
jgi:hypothetical protein